MLETKCDCCNGTKIQYKDEECYVCRGTGLRVEQLKSMLGHSDRYLVAARRSVELAVIHRAKILKELEKHGETT
jgi:RecJ-like exonuclease